MLRLKLRIPLIRDLMLLTCGLLMSTTAVSQLPTATQIANNMKLGWNHGNSMEVPGDETGWGNPPATQALIDGVKAAGFNTVRIPCAWDSYANQSTHQISSAWLARVKEVVDYCYSNDMYVILNSHWDNGWLEEHPFYANQAEVNEKQYAYWTQIANYFASYDEHLLFAGTNEVRADYGEPTSEYIDVQESYNQTFINAVRNTGGNNQQRTLIVQTYNTNAWHGLTYFTLPNDPASGRLMVEVHYYDAYDFALNPDDNACPQWDSGNCSWAGPGYVEDLFDQMQQRWVNQGIPVVIGEYGALKRPSAGGAREAERLEWLEYMTDAAFRHGMVPVYWDNGVADQFGLFNRNNGNVIDQAGIDALMAAVSCTPSTITPYVQVNGGSWNETASASLTAGGSVKFGPQPVQSAGWSWSGPNGFSASTREVTISNIQANQAGNYVATYTNSGGCQSTQAINVTVTTSTGGGTGTILREYWTGITGTGISNLTSNSNYPDNPAGSGELTSLEGPTNFGDNYGTRIRGYVHPTASGSYTFWVAGDDNTDLYLSTNDNPANRTRIAYVNGWTNSREWTKYSSQQSVSVNLTAGQKYYIEVLHKEGGGGDNVAVAWQGPGISRQVIGGSYLSPYDPGSTSGTIVVRARGTQGSENIDLRVNGTTIASWTLTTSMANYTASGNGQVTVHFTNDAGGRDVQVDYITHNVITYQSENQVTNTGVWQDGSCGGSSSEWLHCTGYIEFSSASARLAEHENVLANPDQLRIVVYPNPSMNGQFYIDIPSTEGATEIQIFSVQGKLVHSQVLSGADKIHVNSELNPGIYLIKIHSESIHVSRKLVIR